MFSIDLVTPFGEKNIGKTSGGVLSVELLKLFPNGLPNNSKLFMAGEEITIENCDIELTGDVTVSTTPTGNGSATIIADPVVEEIPEEEPETQNVTNSPTNNYSVQQNLARVGERIPEIYGKIRVFPDLIAQPFSRYTDTDGNDGFSGLDGQGRNVFRNNQLTVDNKFLSSKGFGRVVENTARVGDSRLDTLGATYTFEEFQPSEEVGGEFVLESDITSNVMPYAYAAQKKLTLYEPANLLGDNLERPCFLIAVEATEPDVVILDYIPPQVAPELNPVINFFNWAFADALVGDLLTITDNPLPPQAIDLDGDYRLVGVFTGDDTLQIKLRSVDKTFQPLSNLVLNTPAKIEGERLKGNLTGLELNKLPFIELDKNIAAFGYADQAIYINLNLPSGIQYISSVQGGQIIQFQEYTFDGTDWNPDLSAGQSSSSLILDSKRAETKRTIRHVLSTTAKTKLRNGERVGIAVSIAKIAEDDGIGFLSFEPPTAGRQDENGQDYGISPVDLTDFLVNDAPSVSTGQGTIEIESVYQYFKTPSEVYVGHVVKTRYQEKRGFAAEINGNFNFVFQRQLPIFDFLTETYDPTPANTRDFRQAVMNHLVINNQIPLDKIDTDSLNAVIPLGGDSVQDNFNFDYAFSNKKNKLLDEVAAILSPFKGHVLRSGAFLTFGHESGSKPIISTITGRNGFLSRASINRDLLVDGDVNGLEVSYKSEADDYQVRIVRVYPASIPEAGVNFKKVRLNGITGKDQAKTYAKVVFNLLFLATKKVSVQTTSSMWSIAPFSRVKMANPMNYGRQFETGSSSNKTAVEFELIDLEPDGYYKISEGIDFTGVTSLQAVVTDVFGEVVGEYIIFPRLADAGSPNVRFVGFFFQSSPTPITSFHYLGQEALNPDEGGYQVGARCVAWFSEDMTDNNSDMDDYLISSIEPRKNHLAQVKLIEYNENFYDPEYLAGQTTVEFD